MRQTFLKDMKMNISKYADSKNTIKALCTTWENKLAHKQKQRNCRSTEHLFASVFTEEDQDCLWLNQTVELLYGAVSPDPFMNSAEHNALTRPDYSRTKC